MPGFGRFRRSTATTGAGNSVTRESCRSASASKQEMATRDGEPVGTRVQSRVTCPNDLPMELADYKRGSLRRLSVAESLGIVRMYFGLPPPGSTTVTFTGPSDPATQNAYLSVSMCLTTSGVEPLCDVPVTVLNHLTRVMRSGRSPGASTRTAVMNRRYVVSAIACRC